MLSDKESVHIWLSDEPFSLFRIDFTAVNYSDLLSKFGMDDSSHPVSNVDAGFLCIYRADPLASLNAMNPNRLVANDDPVPVLGSDPLGHGL